MFGCVKDYGWYVKGQFNGTVSVVDGTGWYTGNEKRRFWSASAGAVARVYGPLFAYLGAGYETFIGSSRMEHTAKQMPRIME